MVAFLDDHSRFVTGYRWGWSEDSLRAVTSGESSSSSVRRVGTYRGTRMTLRKSGRCSGGRCQPGQAYTREAGLRQRPSDTGL
jgi:hypothetical protein